MKLSVIVPSYRLASYIHECLLSLVTQKTDFPFEVIVCDDGSQDDTAAAIAPLENSYSHLKVMTNPSNLGLVATMARLLETCQGDYIAYLDGDDVAFPGKLQAQADYLDAVPGCGIVYHESQVFDSNTGVIGRLFSRDYYNAQYIPRRAAMKHLILYGVFLQASSIMIRRHDYLMESLNHGCEIICDFPWHIQNAHYTKGSIDRIDTVLGRYRIHDRSFNALAQKDVLRRIKVTRELELACTNSLKFGVDADTVAKGISQVRFAAALYFLRQGEYGHFRQMIEEAENEGWYFDDRHAHAYKNRFDPEAVQNMLGWCERER